jgi:hypothetical protein
MAEGNTEQVTQSTDNFDINAIAEEMGIKTATTPPPAADEKKTEPDANTEPEAEEEQSDEAATETDEPEETSGEGDEEAEDKEEDEKPESQDQEPEASDKIQRRIDRITAEKHELREERDAIKAELEALRKQAEAKPPVVTIEPDNPLSSLTDASALQAEIDKAQAALDWADDNRDGGTVTIAGEEKFYDADAVKQIKANAKSLLRNAPKQQEYLRLREGLLPAAQAAYPELFQQGTVPKAYLDASLKAYPWLTRFPGYELIVGDAFVGQNMREAKEQQQQRKLSGAKAAKSPAPTAKVMKTPSPGARPKVSGSEAALRQKAERVFKSGGNADALTDYLEAIV